MKKSLYFVCIICLGLMIGYILIFQPGVKETGGALPEAETEGKLHLTLATIEAGAFTEKLEEAVETFNQTNTDNLEIECLKYDMEEYKNELALQMAVNDPPDIFFTWERGFFHAYAETGKLYDLSGLLQDDTELREIYGEMDLSAVTMEDKVWALPVSRSAAWVYYNKEVFQAHCWEVPESYEEFLNLCEEMRAEGMVPMDIAGQETWASGQLFQQMIIGVGGSALYEGLIDGRISWNSALVQEAAQELQNWNRRGYFNEEFERRSSRMAAQSILAGESGMTFNGSWEKASWGSETEKIGVFLLPAKNKENQGVAIGSVDNSFALSSQCENIEGAVGFLKYLCSDEFQTSVMEDGYLPVLSECVDRSQPDPFLEEIFETYGTIKETTVWFDRIMETDMGEAINSLAQRLMLGHEAETLLDTFQQRYGE